jgi:hypothetical protein
MPYIVEVHIAKLDGLSVVLRVTFLWLSSQRQEQ